LYITSHRIYVFISERKEGKVISDWNNHTLHTCCIYYALLKGFKAMKIRLSCSALRGSLQISFYYIMFIELNSTTNKMLSTCTDVKQSGEHALWSKICL